MKQVDLIDVLGPLAVQLGWRAKRQCSPAGSLLLSLGCADCISALMSTLYCEMFSSEKEKEH